MFTWIYALASVVIVSLISLVGIFTLTIKREALSKMTLFLVSFAVGGLFGDAFIHILPEAFEKFDNNIFASLYILAGILIFFVLEKFLRWRHCHHTCYEGEHEHPVVTINLIGDGVHNFIDGMIIGASYCVSPTLGFATTLAVILHEIPQEIGDFGILIHAGLPVKKALFFNFLSAAMAVFGAVISLFIGSKIEAYAALLLPITAGGFIYLAGSDLIPELHAGCDAKPSVAAGQFLCIVFGILVMLALVLVD